MVGNHLFTFSQRLSSSPDIEYGSVCNFLVALNSKDEDEGVPFCDEGKDCSSPASNITAFKGNITLSPNPSSENVALNFELLDDNTITVIVADMYGKIVKTASANQQYKAGANTIRFSTSDLPEGVYIVGISANAEKKSMQLIVKH